MKTTKRFLSMLLTAALICGLLSAGAVPAAAYNTMFTKQPNQPPRIMVYGEQVTLETEVFLPGNIVGEPRYQWYRGYYSMGWRNGYEKPVEGANSTSLTIHQKTPKDGGEGFEDYATYYYFIRVEATLDNGVVHRDQSEDTFATYHMNYWQSYGYVP